MPDSTAAIRSWAQNNGHHVAERGRLSVEVREAYAKAQKSNRSSKATEPRKVTSAKAPAVTRKPSATKAKAPAPSKRPAPAIAPIVAVSEPRAAEDAAADSLAVRVAALEKQLKDVSARLVAVETKKRVFGGRRSA